MYYFNCYYILAKQSGITDCTWLKWTQWDYRNRDCNTPLNLHKFATECLLRINLNCN